MEYTREELEAMLKQVDENTTHTQSNVVMEQLVDAEKIVPIRSAVQSDRREYSEIDITSVSDMKLYADGKIIELPGFDDEHKFIVKLRRPSLLLMVKSGKIPNSLINQATQLFQKGASSLGKDNTIADMYSIMETVCDAAMVKPTYKEIKDAGISLTDEQMMAIFSYTQQGVKALEQFR